MPRIDQEPNPFQYIGGQPKAIETLLAAVAQERRGNFSTRKPLYLLSGEAGMGKTALVKATAEVLHATLIPKTPIDFLSGQDLNPFLNPLLMHAGYNEARHAASDNKGKALYALEGFDTIMEAGPRVILSELVANIMTDWSEDLEGNVLVIATATDKNSLRPSVLSRFTLIELELPGKTGITDMLLKGVARLSDANGRTDIFEDPLDPDTLIERMVDLRWTPRAMTNFLRHAINLRGQKEPWQPIDISFLMTLIPRPKRLGFRQP